MAKKINNTGIAKSYLELRHSLVHEINRMEKRHRYIYANVLERLMCDTLTYFASCYSTKEKEKKIYFLDLFIGSWENLKMEVRALSNDRIFKVEYDKKVEKDNNTIIKVSSREIKIFDLIDKLDNEISKFEGSLRTVK